jgi:hypothetical protein
MGLSHGWKLMAVETRWDEKARLRRDAVGSQVIDVLEAQIKRRPAFSSHLIATVIICGHSAYSAKKMLALEQISPEFLCRSSRQWYHPAK